MCKLLPSGTKNVGPAWRGSRYYRWDEARRRVHATGGRNQPALGGLNEGGWRYMRKLAGEAGSTWAVPADAELVGDKGVGFIDYWARALSHAAVIGDAGVIAPARGGRRAARRARAAASAAGPAPPAA